MKLNHYILQWIMFAALLIPPCIGSSQNYTEDIKKITEKFKQGDLSYHVKYCFYPFDSLKKVTDSMNAYCYMSGQEYYCRITSSGKSFEYCKNSKYYFIVDHVMSAIAVKKSSEAKQQVWDIDKVDSLIHAPGVKVSYKSLSSSEGEYVITMKGRQWDRIKLVFNKSDFTLEKMYMCSTAKGKINGTDYNKPMIGVYYSGYSEKQFDKNIFSEGKFFYDAKNGIVLNDSYKKYKLLDYIYKLSKRG